MRIVHSIEMQPLLIILSYLGDNDITVKSLLNVEYFPDGNIIVVCGHSTDYKPIINKREAE